MENVSSERPRPPNTGKRKLKSLMASRDPPEVPRWLPEPPRGPPGAVLEPPQKTSRGPPKALPGLYGYTYMYMYI